jgi:hypothetical protein
MIGRQNPNYFIKKIEKINFKAKSKLINPNGFKF